ncbi:MAG: DUF3857 domain-containing protein [Chitinophagaceae bacterium]|nr:DUF3857 domain-containing protein [Oligoflexus sp.]
MTKPFVRALAPIFFIVLLSTQAEARWESLDEASAITQIDQNFEINKDGTYKYTFDVNIDIKKDGARSAYGTVPMRYNSGRSRVTSVVAETIFQGKTQKVPKDQIEDKPEKAKDVGFDKTHNLSIAFPSVNVGSVLHYKVTWEHHTVPITGQFSENIYYGVGSPTLPPSKTHIVSKIPLTITIDDPDHYLAVEHHKKGDLDIVDIKLLRPVYFQPVNEKHDGWYKKSPFPQVAISSTENWADVGKAFTRDYEVEMSKPLPEAFARVADESKLKTSFVDRSNAFTAGLAEIVRYHGDWRTRKGSYIPRPLQTIRTSQFGDCKDMAIVTAASLRRMGYKTNVALVNRGYDKPKPMLLPGTGMFNHAIVRAEDEQGHVRWIDPTNAASRAQAIRADIAGRPALVLDGAHSRLETTTDMRPEDSQSFRTVSYAFDPNTDQVKTKMQLVYKGFLAERLTAWELSDSKRQIAETLLARATDSAEILSSEIEPFDLRSRIVNDLVFEMRYTSAYKLEETTAGLAFNLAPANESLGRLDTKDRMSGYYLGTPESYELVRSIKDAELIGSAVKPCQFKSQWIDGERSIEALKGAITIVQRVTNKVYGIGAEEFASQEFKSLQKNLQNCLGSYTIVFKKAATSSPEIAASTH